MNLLTKARKIITHEGKSDIKNEINVFFAEYTFHILRHHAKSLALYLDGKSARTTLSLINCGVDKNRIIPVSYENDPSLFYNMSNLVPNTFQNKLMSDVISDSKLFNGNILGSVWLDYNCTWEGSKTNVIRPSEDLERLFIYNRVVDQSLISLTCSFRVRKRIDGNRPSHNIIKNKIKHDILNIIKTYGFVADIHHKIYRNYSEKTLVGGWMCFFWFILRTRQNTRKPTIKQNDYSPYN